MSVPKHLLPEFEKNLKYALEKEECYSGYVDPFFSELQHNRRLFWQGQVKKWTRSINKLRKQIKEQ